MQNELKQEDNYRLLLKAFSSKNARVLNVLYKIVLELGDIADRVPLFLETLASAALVKTFKTSKDIGLKLETTVFLRILCECNRTTAVEMAKYGAVQTIIDDLAKYTKGTHMISSYLEHLLAMMAMVAR